jgi:hypothetical protein
VRLSKRVSATLWNSVVKSLIMIQSLSCSWWQNCQILTSDLKSRLNVPSSTSSSQNLVSKNNYWPWWSMLKRTSCKLRNRS